MAVHGFYVIYNPVRNGESEKWALFVGKKSLQSWWLRLYFFKTFPGVYSEHEKA
jgi:hypothetical protein